jgi:cytochrome c553
MKIVPIIVSTLLLSASPLVIADNPMSDMMNTAKEMTKSGTDAAKEVLHTGKDAASNVVDKTKDVVGFVKGTLTGLDDSGTFKWTAPLIDSIVKGDPKKGEALAKEGKCSKCHGDTGISDEDDTPSIAGQIAAYSYKQLHDYKTKVRDDKSMFKKVKNLSNQDMIDLSAWYAQQKPEAKAGTDKNIPVLANKGDRKRFLLPCDTCHDDEAMKRGFQTPIIEGQKPQHFIDTMIAFKEGDRENDHYNLMRSITKKLTEDEINELAAYYATKPTEDDDD